MKGGLRQGSRRDGQEAESTGPGPALWRDFIRLKFGAKEDGAMISLRNLKRGQIYG